MLLVLMERIECYDILWLARNIQYSQTQDDETLEQLSKEWTPFTDCQLIERQVDIIANLVYN